MEIYKKRTASYVYLKYQWLVKVYVERAKKGFTVKQPDKLQYLTCRR